VLVVTYSHGISHCVIARPITTHDEINRTAIQPCYLGNLFIQNSQRMLCIITQSIRAFQSIGKHDFIHFRANQEVQ